MTHARRLATLSALALTMTACGAASPDHDAFDDDPVVDRDEAGAGESFQAVAGSAFVHPGILVTRGMLDFVKARANAGAEPWKTALQAAKADQLGSLSYVPHPRADVNCGPYSIPDNGCSAEKDDSAAAYTQALLWYHTGNEAYARKAIEIMNAWSATLRTHTNLNAPLQAAWAAEVFPRAAEIIRYTYSGWAAADVSRFKTMLGNVYLPLLINGSDSNGNWELSMTEAVMNIGIFNDDRATFDRGVSLWRGRVPAYIYLQEDGPKPIQPPKPRTDAGLIGFWYNQSTFVSGLSQETCRDLSHVQYGLAAAINAGQTAQIQGVDLLTERGKRLRAGLEFHAQLINGLPVPAWLCGGKLKDTAPNPMWDIAYNAYANVQHQAMPNTAALLARIRPTSATHHMVWETLTHGDIGSPSTARPARLVSRASGKCLDVAGASSADGANVRLWTCNGTPAQQYLARDIGGGLVNLVNAGSSKCVDLTGGRADNGTNIELWTCNGSSAQKFRLQDAGSGFVSVVNAGSGKCLDVEGQKTTDGANVQQWACANTPNQQWKLGN